MHSDPAEARDMRLAVRPPAQRRPWLRLLSAVTSLAGPQAAVVRHAERPWASVTFAGARHTIVLRFTGQTGIDAAETFIAALPEHEFDLPGRIVADAAVVAVDQMTLPEPQATVEVELLLLED
jgi:hypothetical protein